MTKVKIKTNDLVRVISGKDRGKTGKIEKVIRNNSTVIVSGINQAKRHRKASGRYATGGIITKLMPISIANVQVVCPHCQQLTKVGFQVTEKTKLRICKKCQANIDTTPSPSKKSAKS